MMSVYGCPLTIQMQWTIDNGLLTQPNNAWVAELVDARDLKSLGPSGCAGSIPAPGTNKINNLEATKRGLFFVFGVLFG